MNHKGPKKTNKVPVISLKKEKNIRKIISTGPYTKCLIPSDLKKKRSPGKNAGKLTMEKKSQSEKVNKFMERLQLKNEIKELENSLTNLMKNIAERRVRDKVDDYVPVKKSIEDVISIRSDPQKYAINIKPKFNKSDVIKQTTKNMGKSLQGKLIFFENVLKSEENPLKTKNKRIELKPNKSQMVATSCNKLHTAVFKGILQQEGSKKSEDNLGILKSLISNLLKQELRTSSSEDVFNNQIASLKEPHFVDLEVSKLFEKQIKDEQHENNVDSKYKNTLGAPILDAIIEESLKEQEEEKYYGDKLWSS